MRNWLTHACGTVIAILGLLPGVAVEAGTPPKVSPGRMSLRTYGADDGLSNPVVWCLAVDPKGFVWVGTEDGVFRFDGDRFRGYSQKDGLPSSVVEHMLFEPDGSLWIGTYGGLARKTAGGIQTIGPGQGVPATRIMGIGRDGDGRLWVATDEGVSMRAPDGRFAPVPGWPGGRLTALLTQGSPSQVWVAYAGNGRSGVRRWQNGIWHELKIAPEPQDAVSALAIGKSGIVWARSASNLWSCEGGDEDGFAALEPAVPPVTREPSLYVDALDRLWVPNEQGVLRIKGRTREQWTERQGFTPKVVHAVLRDSEGSIWFGGDELSRVQGGGVFSSYQRADGLPDNGVWCILRDRAGRLLVGTDSGLAVSNEQGFDAVAATAGFQVRSAAVGPDGAVYATGHPAVIRWDPVTNAVRRFGSESGFESGGRSFRLLFDREGTLFVATEGAGLMRGTLRQGRVSFVREPVPGGQEVERFTDLLLDREGRVWAAGAFGLAVRDAGVWRRFTVKDGLRINEAGFVRSLADGGLVFAYFGAPTVTRATYVDGVFAVDHTYDHVFPTEQVVYLLGEDARQNLWVGGGQGLDMLLANGADVEHFGRREGLASENISNMAFFAEGDGTVWFGTTNGLLRFDPSVYIGVPTPPAAAILEVGIGNEIYEGDALTHLRIPHQSNTIEIVVASPSSIRDESVQHDVRLVGLENEWRRSASRRERYPKLPPGTYTFEVKARIALGAFGPTASWSFTIVPAWWQTWWFRVLAFVIAVVALGWAATWRTASLRRRNQLLEGTVAARTAELHAANEQLRDQSLTDPLTGLRNRRYLDSCMVEDTAQALRRRTDVREGRGESLKANIDLLFLMIDLDRFKHVNDTHGHLVGDFVLKQAANVIRSATRNSDTVVRWGGEEFLVVARATSRQHASTLAERIRAMMERHEFEIDPTHTIRVTCSVGFAFFPLTVARPDAMTWELVVNLADRCLYAAKRSGRNGWVGLIGAGDTADDTSVRDLTAHLAERIASGAVQAISSHPPGTPLEWDPPAGVDPAGEHGR